jgi:hypothetical protein
MQVNGELTNLNGKNDTMIKTMKEEKELPHSELTRAILSCYFEVYRFYRYIVLTV